MIRRQKSMRFLGGFYAFPGGKVEPTDEISRLGRLLAGRDDPGDDDALDLCAGEVPGRCRLAVDRDAFAGRPGERPADRRRAAAAGPLRWRR